MHNAALISEKVVKMNFECKGTLPTDTSEEILATPISVVDYVVFHGYKCWYYTGDQAY